MRPDKTAYILNAVGILCGAVLTLWGLGEWLWAVTLVGLALVGYNVFSLVRRKRRRGGQEDPAFREQDAPHTEELQGLQARLRLWRLFFWIASAAAVVTWLIAFFSGLYAVAVILTVAAVILKWVADHQEQKRNTYISEHLVKQVLEETFEVSSYATHGCVDREAVKSSNFGVGSFDDMGGIEHMKGSYRGAQVELCDLNLTTRKTRFLEDGRTEDYNDTVYRGLWMVCELGKELPAHVRLWERGAVGKLVSLGGMRTAHESFHKQFHIECDNEWGLSGVLTPALMDSILEFDRKARGTTRICFERGGRVQIAVERDRDSFAVGRHTEDATALRRQFIAEVENMTALLDAVLAMGDRYL